MFEGVASVRTRRKILALWSDDNDQGEAVQIQKPRYVDTYRPLNRLLAEIRLLEVVPCSDSNAPIEANLRTVSLLDKPEYEALSYCWGDPMRTSLITLAGQQKAVTVNLEAALRQFRADAGSNGLVLWVDAVCINQDDLQERTQQVLLMRQVYAQASCVRIWLGREDESTALAFSMLGRTGEVDSTALDAHVDTLRNGILALGVLFRNPYWRRVWIYQEIALARSISLHCGKWVRSLRPIVDIINLNSFARRLMHWTSNPDRFRPAVKGVVSPEQIEGALAHEIIHGIHPLFIVAKDIFDTTIPIETATTLAFTRAGNVTIHNLRGAKCSIEHDHVYGILGLIPEEWGIRPDYSQTLSATFADFAAKAMLGMGNLELLYYTPPSDPRLPSWTPDWRVALTRDDLPVGQQSMYNASAGTALEIEPVSRHGLRIRGIFVDKIVYVGPKPVYQDFILPGTQVIETAGVPTRHVLKTCWIPQYSNVAASRDHRAADDTIDQALVRAIFAGATSESRSRNEIRPDDEHRMREHDSSAYTLKIQTFLDTGESDESGVCAGLVDHVSRYTFFVTALGRPGRAKAGIEVGDKICIFSNGQVPFCLREDGDTGGRMMYKIVSPCYVDGIMDGEAVLSAQGAAEVSVEEVRVEDVFEDFYVC